MFFLLKYLKFWTTIFWETANTYVIFLILPWYGIFNKSIWNFKCSLFWKPQNKIITILWVIFPQMHGQYWKNKYFYKCILMVHCLNVEGRKHFPDQDFLSQGSESQSYKITRFCSYLNLNAMLKCLKTYVKSCLWRKNQSLF